MLKVERYQRDCPKEWRAMERARCVNSVVPVPPVKPLAPVPPVVPLWPAFPEWNFSAES